MVISFKDLFLNDRELSCADAKTKSKNLLRICHLQPIRNSSAAGGGSETNLTVFFVVRLLKL